MTSTTTERRTPPATPRRSGKPVSLTARRRRTALVAWLFAAPFVLSFGVFGLVPLVSSFGMAFTDLRVNDIRNPFAVDFIGLGNFATVLSDTTFLRALRNTLGFVVVGVPLSLFSALVLAVMLNALGRRAATFFRVGFYTPVVTTIVAVAVVWRIMYQPNGLINSLLADIGVDGPNWLGDTRTALPALTLMAVWRSIGSSMVIFLAGLQAIPSEVKEAAMVDGASTVQRFFRITIPMMMPTILLNAILTTTGFMQFFDEPFVMTNGGPLQSTTSIALYVFNQFQWGSYSVGAAGAYVLFAIISIFAIIQFRFFRQRT
ncbi:carbohydrate ABC transporter permease [Cellulomonas hominis]|uniref:carbohydrate ABC transporter permease n=1 Tax=Cellulomonas hominis TaxID=156981 RepID=UPI001B9BAED5|nr:sugar ABC transporter permease [Cellulomonas hominis]VTR77411.1 Lactose transport system permease protein LacF [Cellulomonas hominis]